MFGKGFEQATILRTGPDGLRGKHAQLMERVGVATLEAREAERVVFRRWPPHGAPLQGELRGRGRAEANMARPRRSRCTAGAAGVGTSLPMPSERRWRQELI
jgi:hypothetical protein